MIINVADSIGTKEKEEITFDKYPRTLTSREMLFVKTKACICIVLYHIL